MTDQLLSHPLDSLVVVGQSRSHHQKVVLDLFVLIGDHLVVFRVELGHALLDPLHIAWDEVGVWPLDLIGCVKTCGHKDLAWLIEMDLVGSYEDQLGVRGASAKSRHRHDTTSPSTYDHDGGFLATAATTLLGPGRRAHPKSSHGSKPHDLEGITTG